MKKLLSADFQTRLWNTVNAVEQHTQAELVVVFRPNSGTYTAIPLSWGILAAWLTHTYLMLAPSYFEDMLVHYAPLLAFFLGFAVAHLPLIKRISCKKTVLQKNVEIMARAIFQKGGVHHTQAKVGLLVYCSFLEKSVYLLPDRGLEMAIPTTEWVSLRQSFQGIFQTAQPHEALLTQLAEAGQIFSQYLPVLPNDINELPDVLEIDL